jgi:transcription elongation factor Elf1
MTTTEAAPRTTACPDCGGLLSEPVSGDVHCYVHCMSCGHRFDLNDPRVNLE